VDVRGDAFDVGSDEAVRAHRMKQRVGGRMGVPARRVELERRLGERPALTEAVDEPRRIGVARERRAHPLCALEDAARAGEAVGGEVRRGQSCRRGVRGVQLLRVGGFAQELPQSRGLRSRRAERMRHLLGVEAKQAPDRGSGGERSRGAGRVEDAVVRAPRNSPTRTPTS
jgi:hypothetical protein